MSNKEDSWFNSSNEKEKKEKKPFSFFNNFKKAKKQKDLAKKANFFSKYFSFKNFRNYFEKIGAMFGSWYLFIDTKLNARPLAKKILWTLLLIAIFRIAASITIPLISVDSSFGNDSSSFIGIMDMMGGGALRNFSIVALGISPYITSSIIMQLLSSEAFPPLYRLSRSGPAGKRKINIITRFVTIFFAIVQAITIIQQLDGGMVHLDPRYSGVFYKYIALPLILVSGSLFTLFLGDQITNKGVGNGTTLIIFSGIAVNLPSKFRLAFVEIVEGNQGQSVFIGLLNFLVYLGVFLLLIYVIGYIYKAERHIPIQQTGAGMSTDRTQLSHLPIKINPAGVMPIIFSLTITVLPVTVAQFLNHQSLVRIWIETNMRMTSPIGLSMFIVLTFLFTIVMALVTFNPFQVADGFKKNGTFIPGVRPGDETEEYLTKIILRLSVFSAFYLSIISAIQYVEEIIGLNPNITFSGTGLIILVSASIETISQVKARNVTQQISRQTKKAMLSSNDKTGGLIW